MTGQEPAIVTIGDDAMVIVPDGPPSESLSPGEWVRKRLFPTPFNGLVTVVLGIISLYLGYRLFRFVFITGRWEPVSRNLELFMIGTFPRGEDNDQRWRIFGQILLMSTGVGIFVGALSAGRRELAAETGEPLVRESWKTYLSSYWSIVLFVGVLLIAFTRTVGPWLLTGGAIVLAVVGWAIGQYLPRTLRPLAWTLAALAVVISFQLLSGTRGWAWFYTTLALVPLLNDLVGRIGPSTIKWLSPAAVAAGIAAGLWAVTTQSTIVGIAALLVAAWAALQFWQGDRVDAARLGLFMVAAVIVVAISRAIDHDAVDWAEWSGLHLSLVVAACSILLAFPIGVMWPSVAVRRFRRCGSCRLPTSSSSVVPR